MADETTEWRSNNYWRNRSVEERIQNLRIPARFRNKGLHTFDTDAGDKDAFDAVSKWYSSLQTNLDEGMGLLLYGPTGVGKTHIAQGLLQHAVANNNLSGAFVTTDRFMDMIYDSQKNDGMLPAPYKDPNFLKYIRRIFDIVVLDGLGAERATTEFARKEIPSLIDNRYEEQLTTIVTTPLSPNEIGRIYGQRILSILQESCYFIHVEGKDYRTAFSDAE